MVDVSTTNVKWWLYFDDERLPTHSFEHFRIARSVEDAMFYISKLGLPDYMTLDHDMGYGRQTGMDFVKALCRYIKTQRLKIEDDFHWEVHSMNPIGRTNMISYMSNFLKMYKAGEI